MRLKQAKSRPELHVLTTGKQSLAEVVALLERLSVQAFAAVDALHIREKQRSAAELITWYERLRTCLPAEVDIYINDRVDVALTVGASGVQLPGNGIDVKAAKACLPNGSRIGRSVHSVEEAQTAASNGADYVLFGHIFATASKAGLAARGLEALAELSATVDVPVVAIGGVNASNAAEVLCCGGAGVAVMSAFFLHAQPQTELLAIRAALDAASISGKEDGHVNN